MSVAKHRAGRSTLAREGAVSGSGVGAGMAAAPTGVNLAQVAAVLGAAWIMDLSSLTPEEVSETSADIRQRDQEGFALEMTGGIYAGVGLLHGNAPIPAPLFKPRKLEDIVPVDQTAPLIPLETALLPAEDGVVPVVEAVKRKRAAPKKPPAPK